MTDRPVFGWRTLDWGVILTLVLQMVFLIYWASNTRAEVVQNTEDIAALEIRLENVNNDIRAILVGIEQVKARLGIVESR